MPVVTIKAKQRDNRTHKKIDALMQDVRKAVSKHLDVPRSKVLVIYEESTAGLFWDGESARPGSSKK